MPTIFAHALTAAAAGQWVPPALRNEMAGGGHELAWTARRFWMWSVVCAMLPDADVIGFGFGIQQVFFRGLDVNFGAQRILRGATGLQFGVSVSWVRLP